MGKEELTLNLMRNIDEWVKDFCSNCDLNVLSCISL